MYSMNCICLFLLDSVLFLFQLTKLQSRWPRLLLCLAPLLAYVACVLAAQSQWHCKLKSLRKVSDAHIVCFVRCYIGCSIVIACVCSVCIYRSRDLHCNSQSSSRSFGREKNQLASLYIFGS